MPLRPTFLTTNLLFVHKFVNLWELTTFYQEVLGCAYWYLRFGPLGVPEEIWILPAQNVTPRRNPNSRQRQGPRARLPQRRCVEAAEAKRRAPKSVIRDRDHKMLPRKRPPSRCEVVVVACVVDMGCAPVVLPGLQGRSILQVQLRPCGDPPARYLCR